MMEVTDPSLLAQLNGDSSQPINVRNNNPGNMRGSDGNFASYDSPKAGLDAMHRDLSLKVAGNSPVMKSKFGDNYQPTLRNVISTWAPDSENDTAHYLDFVAKHAGIDPDSPISETDIPKIMQPMVQMEGGQKASQYFGKLMQDAPKQMADSGEIKTDAQVDGPQEVTDPELLKQLNAKAPDKFDTVADQALEGATFGLGNRASAGLAALVASGINGKSISDNYKDARNIGSDNLEAEFKENPLLSLVANLGGSLATGGMAGGTKAGAAAANSLRSGGTAARIVKGAAAGAATGGAYGAGTARYDQSAQGGKQGALLGLLTGGAIPAVGATASDLASTGKNVIKGAFSRSPEAVQDAAQALKTGAGNLYGQMRQIGATFKPSAVNGFLLPDIDSAIAKNNFIPALNPKTVAIVDDLKQQAASGNLGLDQLDQYRRLLGRVGNTEDGVSAGNVRKTIDDFVNNAKGSDLNSSSQISSHKDLNEAIDEWGGLKELETHLKNSISNAYEGLPNTSVEKFNAGVAGKQSRQSAINKSAEDAANLSSVKKQISAQENKISQIEKSIDAAPGISQKMSQAVDLLNQGRKQYAQASKFEAVADVLQKAAGDPNKIKSGLTRFLNNNNNTRGWTKTELVALKNAASSGGAEKLLKMGGKFGVDLGTSLTPGNTVAPLVGGFVNPALPVAGTVARQAQKYAARGKAENLLNVLQNAPAQTTQNANPLLSLLGNQTQAVTHATPVRIGLEKLKEKE